MNIIRIQLLLLLLDYLRVLVAQIVKNPPARRETWVQSLSGFMGRPRESVNFLKFEVEFCVYDYIYIYCIFRGQGSKFNNFSKCSVNSK